MTMTTFYIILINVFLCGVGVGHHCIPTKNSSVKGGTNQTHNNNNSQST